MRQIRYNATINGVETGMLFTPRLFEFKTASMDFTVEALQGNASTVSEWDGASADTSWYNDTDTEFALDDAAQIAGLADLIDGGNTFAGKTIKLDGDID